MKYTILAATLLTALLSSCSAWLDIKPHSAVSPDQVTDKDLPALRIGMYWQMQEAPRRESYIMGDIVGGNLQGGTDSNPSDLIRATLSPLNSLVAGNWSGHYKALYQVNNVLQSLRSITSPTPLYNTVKGEAHYFRALIYHRLVTSFGGVPILRQNTMEKLPRNSVDEVWAFINEELLLADELLTSSANYNYVSKNAVRALIARVSLHMGNLTLAKEIAEDLITKSNYKLDAFSKIFRGLPNDEVIFAFKCLTADNSAITLSTLFYNYAHPNKGSYIYCPPRSIVNMFEQSDQRASITVTVEGGQDCINKYPSGQTGTDPVIISRLAEMYLISAEAQGFPDGLTRLNELRLKRGVAEISPANDDEFLLAILNERNFEFVAEGFRYYDLVRTGQTDLIGLLPHQKVLPIPGKELQLNPNLEPNPKY